MAQAAFIQIINCRLRRREPVIRFPPALLCFLRKMRCTLFWHIGKPSPLRARYNCIGSEQPVPCFPLCGNVRGKGETGAKPVRSRHCKQGAYVFGISATDRAIGKADVRVDLRARKPAVCWYRNNIPDHEGLIVLKPLCFTAIPFSAPRGKRGLFFLSALRLPDTMCCRTVPAY